MNLPIDRFLAELKDLRAQSLLRLLAPPTGRDFCSNDYLKLAHHPRVVRVAAQGLLEYGFGSSSSRFVRGERAIWPKVEQELALFKGSEAALMFSSGYAANIGALPALLREGDVVFSDALNHASLIDGLRLSRCETLIYRHLNNQDLVDKIKKMKPAKGFIITESLFSMDGDVANLHELVAIARHYDLGLILDESHAVGLFGKRGSGLVEHFDLDPNEVLTINGLGKAMGCYGAFVAGNVPTIELIKQRARSLIYSTALPPLHGLAISQALKLTDEGLRQKLWDNCRALNEELSTVPGFRKNESLSPIFAVITGQNERALFAAQFLQENGFDVRAIRPPSVPQNTARLRCTANVDQTLDEIKELSCLLREVL